MYGQVKNLKGAYIMGNLTLNFTVPYSRCEVSGWIPVQDGIFKTSIPLMSDYRNYYVSVLIENSNYMPS